MGKDDTEKTGGFKRFKDRMGPVKEIEVDKIVISEFNTRCRFVDERQISKLIQSMEENGFIPKCAVWLNTVTEDGSKEGKVVHYRLVAGRHRHESAKRIGMEHIPGQLFYNLDPEEECELDRIDNELDESHEPVNFLAEAEHYKYLNEIKGWNKSQIARIKGVKRLIVRWRIRIADIPEAAKKIIRGGGTMVPPFTERHFREICKLSDPHIIRICAEIDKRWRQANKKVKDENKKLIKPMKEHEIKEMVKKLLGKEKKGEVERVITTPPTDQLELFPSEEAEEDTQEELYFETIATENSEDEEKVEEEPKSPPKPELPDTMIFESSELKDQTRVYFERFPRWVKFSDLLEELGYPNFMVMRMIAEYDVWYAPKKTGPFYLSKDIYGDPLQVLAKGAKVSKEHVVKKILPDLKHMSYIDYKFEKGEFQLEFYWKKLIETYKKIAFDVPFKEGGLKDIPSEFNGTLRPTPLHHVRVVNGEAVEWYGKKPLPEKEQEVETELTPDDKVLVKHIVEKLKIDTKKAEKIISEYPRGRVEKALTIAEEKQNPAGWFLKALEENYRLENGNDGDKEVYAKLKLDANKCFRNCGGGCAACFGRYDKEKDACYWCSKFDSIRDKILGAKN